MSDFKNRLLKSLKWNRIWHLTNFVLPLLVHTVLFFFFFFLTWILSMFQKLPVGETMGCIIIHYYMYYDTILNMWFNFQGNLLLPSPDFLNGKLSPLRKSLSLFLFCPTLLTDPPFLVKKISTTTLKPILKISELHL